MQAPPLLHPKRAPGWSSTHARSRPAAAAASKAACKAAAMPGLGQALPQLRGCIYLDWNATTPIFPEVSAAMLPYVTDHFGNPSSGHTYGVTCRSAVDKARAQVAALVGAQPEEIVFTGCGTESDNWVVYGAVMGARASWGTGSARVPHVVASNIEHPAILAHLKHMEQLGLLKYTLAAASPDGTVTVDAVLAAMTPDTVLVTVMHSNNEVGAISPIAAVAAAVPPHVLVHTDAAQSCGKVPLDVKELGVGCMTIVGHKLGAPKGIAALYIRQGVKLPNFLHGGGQEHGRRAGTENVLLAVGLGAAAEVARREGAALSAHMAAMRDRLATALLAGLPEARVNGPSPPDQRLPNTLSMSIRGLNASAFLKAVSDRLAASAGAACHSSGGGVSGVLQALGVPHDWAVGTLRLSTGRHTTPDEVDAAAALIIEHARAACSVQQ